MPGRLNLRPGPAPSRAPRHYQTVFADEQGALKVIDEDGEVTALGGSGGPQLVTVVEQVVAFDDDLTAGVEVAALTAGQSVLSMGFFVETALTHNSGRVSIKVGSDEVGACSFDFLLSAANLEIGSDILAGAGSKIRASASPISIVAKGLTGTWTAGAIRVVTEITEAA